MNFKVEVLGEPNVQRRVVKVDGIRRLALELDVVAAGRRNRFGQVFARENRP